MESMLQESKENYGVTQTTLPQTTMMKSNIHNNSGGLQRDGLHTNVVERR
ncbi:hypothetical protein DOY81_001219 [Sarcophaga bullata]|nr:hypothetical protein DOY81_001219 [Sarcophaga bullata]